MTSKVEDAVKRHKSRGRHIVPVCAALLRCVMMALVLGAALYGVGRLWQAGLDDPRFRMDGETLALAGAVRECPESVAELESIGRGFHGRSLLDPTLMADMQKAYDDSLWIRRVVQMRRRFPNRVELEFILRLPAAQVWNENRYWLVDDEAALLPVAGSGKMFASLPEIVGATPGVIGRRPQVGGAWTDEGVTGALGIMRSFWGSPLAEVVPVEKVVVTGGTIRNSSPDPDVRRRFEIVSAGGAVVRWGTFNPGNLEGEATSAEKLWRLQELLRRDEAARPGVCFDVRTRLPGYTLLPEG